jgi:hypothetical protein
MLCLFCSSATAGPIVIPRIAGRPWDGPIVIPVPPTDLPPPPKTSPPLSTPAVTYGWVNRTRQVFAGMQKQCVNGVCRQVPTYRAETYPSWEPVASSQHVIGAGESAPTPMAAVKTSIDLLGLPAGSVILEPGCGADARIAIALAKRGYSVLAFEIDAGRYRSAQLAIASSGYGNRINLIHGDSTAYVLDVDGVVAYLYPETLKKIAKRLTRRAKKIVSYMHKIDGLRMQQQGDFYLWVQPQPVTYHVPRQRVAYWQGVAYTAARAGCNCPMCRSLRAQGVP